MITYWPSINKSTLCAVWPYSCGQSGAAFNVRIPGHTPLIDRNQPIQSMGTWGRLVDMRRLETPFHANLIVTIWVLKNCWLKHSKFGRLLDLSVFLILRFFYLVENDVVILAINYRCLLRMFVKPGCWTFCGTDLSWIIDSQFLGRFLLPVKLTGKVWQYHRSSTVLFFMRLRTSCLDRIILSWIKMRYLTTGVW